MSSASPITEDRLITGEELARMPGYYELINGKLITMSPTGELHGGFEGNVYFALRQYVNVHPIGRVRVGEVGMYLTRNPDTVRAADALYISNERYAQRGDEAYLTIAPELVVEVLSPGDAWSDVMQKIRDYLTFGVVVVWVVDPKNRTIHAYRSLTNVQVFTEQDDLEATDLLPGFRVPVTTIFEV
ncbi:MAG: Uma2 family endonuclease [Roseiflexaceae bacterium]